MENKINIAELLKDCPKGMELDCTAFLGPVTYDGLDKGDKYPIRIRVNKDMEYLDCYGCVIISDYAKCVIFPKGKTTWEGFQRPFKDGDVIANNTYVAIFHKLDKIQNGVSNDVVYYHCWCCKKGDDSKFKIDFGIGCASDFRFATEEEKQKLFDAIKSNGYKWNEATKKLEKLIEPKFKVGRTIRHKTDYKRTNLSYKIIDIAEDHYILNGSSILWFNYQESFEYCPEKFNITTLKPFESMVLVRSTNDDIWRPAIYGFTDSNKYYIVGGIYWKQCIPYEGNEHLLGTTNDCDEFYKTWK